ncbi:tetratricopeptide repeat protein 17 isoform X5 [Eulemur rufifrons]|uniref:tetratricopeptide repeat protein 17 isoform X5 n=1 Tax=Eulemur rufifrons TaxID=859984 RepID=UPI00374262D2
MAAAVGVRGRCELPPCSSPGWLFSLSALLSVAARGAFATTHWVVTEDGKIQQQVDSPMNLKHPHDLVILMRQETTVNYLKELEKQLVAQKIHIEENEDRDTGLEQRHNKEDPDCIKAKVPLGDLDLYDGTYITLESKDISPEDYIDTESPVPPDPEQPDCTKILELPYSIHAFQHLRGVQERVNLSAPLLPKEDPIFTYLSKRLGRSIDDIGHLIHEGLQKFGEDSSTSSMMSVNFNVQSNQSDISDSVKSSPVAHSILWIWGRDSDAYRDKQHILWPKRADCTESYPRVPVGGELPTYFLPPENKGLRIHELNSDDYSSEEEAQTPDCSITDFRKSHPLSYLVKELEVRMDLKAKIPDDHARKILLSRINNYTIPEEEIGSFLFHAINKPNAPVWLILNEAGLYWRAVGNSTFAIACLQRALNLAPLQYQDVPLVNLANLLIHYGLHLDATKLLLQALAINSSEPLTFLSLGNAYLALKNISGALEAFRQALKLTTKCPECEDSLKLIRCMQFYPFLYNITSSVCSGNCHEKTLDNSHDKQKYFDNSQSLEAAEEEPSERGTEEDPVLSVEHSGRDSDALRLESTVVEESNGSDEMENSDETKMSEEILALVDEFQQAWPLEGFGGALEMKGRRLDLQGIRVLKKGPQDGVARSSCYGDCKSEDDEATEWITFQVKRVKKPKGDPKKTPGKKAESNQAESGHHHQANLEITGPKVASPGPQGKKRDYQSLGWPSPDECLKLRWVELTAIVSTWLAVSSKNIDITEHIDFATPIQQPAMEPLCNGNLPTSMHTLDHLHGVSNRASLHYTGESQLTEVLQNLGKDQYPQQSLEQIGTRIAKVLEKNQTSWVLSSMAALYWRVKGQGKKAIDCLRQALHYAPHQMKDVPLISLANILHNAKLWNDAVIVATMAVEIAPHFAVNHFTLGNVYVAMEEFEKALVWYESTLKLQPEFVPAKNRIQTIQCHLMLKKGRRSP